MYISKSSEISRRAFLQRASALSTVGLASSYTLGLAGIGDLAAQSTQDDYKALVCVFLYGGNDHANTLIPYDQSNYSAYYTLRGGASGVAIPHSALNGFALNPSSNQVLTDGILYALAPTMPRMKALFDKGALAPVLNIGPLLTPLTKAEFESPNVRAYPRPAKLFSHNDQQSIWQAFAPEGATSGWGGTIGDIALSSNSNSMFTGINASGNTVFLSGNDSLAYRVGTSGPAIMYGLGGNLYGSAAAGQAANELLVQSSDNILASDHARANSRSINYNGFVREALTNAQGSMKFGSGNSVAAQLSIVAQLISIRQQLGVRRQVFFVSMGGFDTHSRLSGTHPGLLGALDQGMDRFFSAMGQLGLENNVTLFTASDFGRTLTSNGDGSDHGWGDHQFVLGGAVSGGQFYGVAPRVSVNSDDQVGRGRLLPSISVDEYASTLAQWFGISENNLPLIAPNIGRFATKNLGFMRSDQKI